VIFLQKGEKKETVLAGLGFVRRLVSTQQTARPRAMGAPKQKWTQDEEEALRRGVLKHGAGKWRTIQKDPDFSPILSSRSNIDLKVTSPASHPPLLVYIIRRGGARFPRLWFFSRVVCFFCWACGLRAMLCYPSGVLGRQVGRFGA
jgi:hypothetical protein